jgi:hypothetical protein
MHIQQVKLEIDGGAYQSEEQLGEVGLEPTQRELEFELSNEIAELESAIEWQVKAMRDGEDGMGDHDDLPICREEM